MPRPRPSGPEPLDPVQQRTARDERRQRAAEEPLDVRPRSVEPYPALTVRNPIHGTDYLVLLPTYPSPDVALCTCSDFARRGLGTCKHIEAARHWLSGHPPDRSSRPPPTTVSELWREIDRAVDARGSDPRPASLAWRGPGRLLFARAGAG